MRGISLRLDAARLRERVGDVNKAKLTSRAMAAGDMNFDITPTKLTVHLDRPDDRLRPRCTDASARRFRNRQRTGF